MGYMAQRNLDRGYLSDLRMFLHSLCSHHTGLPDVLEYTNHCPTPWGLCTCCWLPRSELGNLLEYQSSEKNLYTSLWKPIPARPAALVSVTPSLVLLLQYTHYTTLPKETFLCFLLVCLSPPLEYQVPRWKRLFWICLIHHYISRV